MVQRLAWLTLSRAVTSAMLQITREAVLLVMRRAEQRQGSYHRIQNLSKTSDCPHIRHGLQRRLGWVDQEPLAGLPKHCHVIEGIAHCHHVQPLGQSMFHMRLFASAREVVAARNEPLTVRQQAMARDGRVTQ